MSSINTNINRRRRRSENDTGEGSSSRARTETGFIDRSTDARSNINTTRPLQNLLPEEQRRSFEQTFPVYSHAMVNRGHYMNNSNVYRPNEVESIPSTVQNNLSYNLLTADILCKYFRDPNVRPDHYSKMANINYAPIIKLGLFSVVSMALTAIVKNEYLDPMMDGNIGNSYPSFVSTIYHDVGEPIIHSIGQGIVHGARLTFEQLQRKRKLKNKVKTKVNEATLLQKNYNQDLFESLKLQCLDLYKTLCQNVGLNCTHLEPVECRKLYIRHFDNIHKALIQEYISLPQGIRDNLFGREGTNPFSPNFSSSLNIYLKKWRSAIIEFSGVADEVGLFLAIIYISEIRTSVKKVFSQGVNEMFTSLWDSNRDIYKKVAISCYLGILTGVDDEFMNFFQECIFPHKNLEYNKKKEIVRFQEALWKELETLSQLQAESVHEDIRRRLSFKDLLQDATLNMDLNESVESELSETDVESDETGSTDVESDDSEPTSFRRSSGQSMQVPSPIRRTSGPLTIIDNQSNEEQNSYFFEEGLPEEIENEIGQQQENRLDLKAMMDNPYVGPCMLVSQTLQREPGFNRNPYERYTGALQEITDHYQLDAWITVYSEYLTGLARRGENLDINKVLDEVSKPLVQTIKLDLLRGDGTESMRIFAWWSRILLRIRAWLHSQYVAFEWTLSYQRLFVLTKLLEANMLEDMRKSQSKTLNMLHDHFIRGSMAVE